MNAYKLPTTLALALLLGSISFSVHAGGNGMVLSSKGQLNLNQSTIAAVERDEVDASKASYIRTIGTLLIVLGLMGGTLIWTRRLKVTGGRSTKATSQMEIIERMGMGPRRELLMVRAAGQILVLSASQQEVKLLTQLPDTGPTPETEAPATAEENEPSAFNQLVTSELRNATKPMAPEQPQATAALATAPEASSSTTTPAATLDWPELSVGA